MSLILIFKVCADNKIILYGSISILLYSHGSYASYNYRSQYFSCFLVYFEASIF